MGFYQYDMEFYMGQTEVRLHTDKFAPNKVVSAAKLNHIMAEEKFCFMLQFLTCSEDKVCCNITSEELENQEVSAQKELLLEEFQDVFEEPQHLPPFRGLHDHRIVLKEGSNPVFLRPYRYPPA